MGKALGSDILGLVPFALLFDKSNVAWISAPVRTIVDFALPPRCPACSKIVSDPHAFCVGCWQQLHFLAGPACASCNLPLPYESDGGAQCAACIAKPPRHNGIRAAVGYGDVARNLALRLKYGGRIGLAKIIADALRGQTAGFSNETLIVPVPLHWTRLWWRSFNQSALIAAELQKGSAAMLAPDLLVRKRRTPLLRGMNPKERSKAVNGAFALNPKWHDRIKGANIALIDDVYTSGATTDACVATLKKAGAGSVIIYCWARVLPSALETDSGFAPS
jgi:ComF family protein